MASGKQVRIVPRLVSVMSIVSGIIAMALGVRYVFYMGHRNYNVTPRRGFGCFRPKTHQVSMCGGIQIQNAAPI